MTETNREQLTVIIPCRDEAHNVEQAVDSVYRVIPELDLDVHILLVDDGSVDDTALIMERLCKENPDCRMRVNKHNLGLGRTVLNSYPDIPSDHWISVFPGDNELIFGSIRNLLALRKDHDLVLGYLQNQVIRTLRRRLASYSFSAVVRFIYAFPYRYLNGLKLYKARVFKDIEVVSSGHAFNAELLAKAILRNPNLRVTEAPFTARGRSLGASKAIQPTSILKAIRDVYMGYRSVCRYRDQVVAADLADAGGRDLDEISSSF
ncbi:MAG: glycosyltransferase family 2 protein [bacterium]|nr:glycosyltransferase family 2 protein [bacterium]